MAALSGGEMCIKYLMFAFNLVFWEPPEFFVALATTKHRVHAQRPSEQEE